MKSLTQLDVLLPFSLLPAEFSSDLMRVLKAPALATLLARSRAGANRIQHYDEFARTLPHEAWCAQRFGLAATLAASGSPPLAPPLMHSLQLAPADGYWAIVQPVHIHVASDHLILTDSRQLDLSETEARTLFPLAEQAFAAAGMQLLYGNATAWFVRADAWSELQTSTPDAVCGRSIDIWIPKGAGEREWRKLQNEVQMEWFAHPLNEERQGRGQKTVNSIWLWGGAAATSASPDNGFYQSAFRLDGALAAYRALVPHHQSAADVEQVLAAGHGRHLLLLDNLSAAALAGDWSVWLEQLQELEQHWFEPLLQALRQGRLQRLTLACSNSTQLLETSISRLSLQQFWRPPSLERLRS